MLLFKGVSLIYGNICSYVHEVYKTCIAEKSIHDFTHKSLCFAHKHCQYFSQTRWIINQYAQAYLPSDKEDAKLHTCTICRIHNLRISTMTFYYLWQTLYKLTGLPRHAESAHKLKDITSSSHKAILSFSFPWKTLCKLILTARISAEFSGKLQHMNYVQYNSS